VDGYLVRNLLEIQCQIVLNKVYMETEIHRDAI
jgi:hypothetical protein